MRRAWPVVLLVLAPLAHGVSLPPVDEAAQDASFFSFRARLLDALIARDAEALRAAIHPDVKNSFGGDDGIDAFVRKWSPGVEHETVWRALGEVLAMGGSFDDYGNFAAPYVYSEWPEDIDAFTHVAVTGTRVNVRAAAALDAEVIARVDFAILERIPVASPQGWARVRLDDGRDGYIAKEYVRSPVDYRAIFRREHGRWWLMAFVAGD